MAKYCMYASSSIPICWLSAVWDSRGSGKRPASWQHGGFPPPSLPPPLPLPPCPCPCPPAPAPAPPGGRCPIAARARWTISGTPGSFLNAETERNSSDAAGLPLNACKTRRIDCGVVQQQATVSAAACMAAMAAHWSWTRSDAPDLQSFGIFLKPV